MINHIDIDTDDVIVIDIEELAADQRCDIVTNHVSAPLGPRGGTRLALG